MQPPPVGDTWLGLGAGELPVAESYAWAVQPACGAVVVFSGTVRDHAVDDDGSMRSGVAQLTYEAYEEQALPRFQAIVDELRHRWPRTGRVALLHRVGELGVGESSVLVVVSAPHRPEAFEAARFGIDALKASAPIWKREQWEDGAAWGTGAHPPIRAAEVRDGER